MDQLVHSALGSQFHTRGVVQLCAATQQTARIHSNSLPSRDAAARFWFAHDCRPGLLASPLAGDLAPCCCSTL